MKSYYLSHYFDPKNAAPFLLLSFLGLVIVLAIVLITAQIQVHQKLNAADYSPRTIRQIHSRHRKREYNLVERFFEMVFCSTSILMFLSLYYIIDEKIPEVSVYWQKYQDFILLIFLACSVILNGWLDRALVPLRCITADQKASIRLVSSFYIVLILLYIKFIYLDDNYDALILYFITLAVGRFIYFDFTGHDFCSTVHGVLINLPLLALMGCYSAFVCWYGFHTDFLLTSNGVILSTLLAHLFMDASIFMLDRTRLLQLFL